MQEEKIYDLLMKENEITWQTIIQDLVRTEEMNPWDVDISKLTQKYLETIKKLQEMNFFVSGKVILAAAMLLKIKSNKLVEEDIGNFDTYLFHPEVLEQDEDFGNYRERIQLDVPGLGIKTPQARKRKVALNDLMKALEQALKVERRRTQKSRFYADIKAPDMPQRKINITELIGTMLDRIKSLFKEKDKVTFTTLLSEKPDKHEKVITFIPLLHLDSQHKIDLQQAEPFGEIDIKLK